MLSITKIKTMPKLKKVTVGLFTKVRLVATVFAVVSLVGGASLVHADQYQSQIDALQNQNDQAQSVVNSLTSQATSYQDAISQLQAQVSALQAAIAVNVNKQAALQQQIATVQQEITAKKGQLGATIKAMYIEGQTSTIEELASSQNLSAYVDKQEYQQTVQDQLNTTINQILTLESELQQQKEQLDIVVASEQQQNNQLNSAEQQQQALLNYNQGQQAAYNSQIASNQQQIAALRAEQIAANHKLVSSGEVIASGSCGGGYPATAQNSSGGSWGCDYPLDNTIDNWGMYNRECVSYTAWMVYKTYGYMPYWGGNGNANEWPADARAAGIPTGSTPKVGSVAIYMGGGSDPFGHAMWVTAVNGNGTITVQQYNLYYDGNYYETTIPSAGLVYIYFGG
jgi:surface antigen/peptidoglycan hydrolase CwlO-like protein